MTGAPTNDEDLVALTQQLVDTFVAPRSDQLAESHEFPWEVYEKFAEVGLLALPVPQEYGGVGASVLLQCRIAEIVARTCAISASLVAGPSLASYPIVLAGSEEQKREFLPRLATGELQAAFALTEPNAGSDISSMGTTAVRDGNDYVINGEKCFITRGNVSGLLVVFAKTDPSAPKLSGISAFLVEQDIENGTPGISVDRLERKLGQEASPTAALSFSGLRVPADRRLGGENTASQALRTLHKTRPLAAAVALGVAQGAYDYVRHHLTQRQAFTSNERMLGIAQFVTWPGRAAVALGFLALFLVMLDRCIDIFGGHSDTRLDH